MRACLQVALALSALLAADARAADIDWNTLPVERLATLPAIAPAAAARAQPVYARRCAACHGADRAGDTARGVPNLADAVWLWGDGTADSELEALVETLRVGIRSAHPKTRAVTVMPAYGAGGRPEARLSLAQIEDLTQLVLALSGQDHDPAAAQRGRALYAGAANCISCHGPDGSGNSDYGASDLTVRLPSAWVYGRTPEAIRDSIVRGRAGTCPAWGGVLPEADLKALALWLRGTAQ